MKKLILSISLFAGICVIAAGCLKDNSTNVPALDCSTVTTAAPSSEIFTLKQYLDSNDITAVQDPRGFYYTMDSAVAVDSGTHPLSCNNVAVTYKGTFLNKITFDSSNIPVAVPLPNTIPGWKEAIPLMRKNASMTLYLPPALAYGASGSNDLPQTIPPNSYLIFTVKLYDFAN